MMEPKQPGYNTNFGAWGGPNLDSIKELRTKYEERSKKHRRRGQGIGGALNIGLGVAMVAIGAIDHDECVGNKATLFLIIGGSVLLYASILRVLAWLAPWPNVNDISEKNAGYADFALMVICIWGSIDVFGARGDGRIEYEDSTSQHYCPYTPFRMAFVYLIIYWVFFFLSCCAPCWMGLGGCGKKKSNVVVVVNDIPDPHDVVSLPTVSKRVDAQSPPRYNDLIF